MTVIAWDKNYLVTDGRCTMGFDMVTDSAVKIHAIEHPEFGELMGAFCGAVMVVEPWIEHIEENGFAAFDGLPDDPHGTYDASAIVIKPDGTAIELQTNGLWSTVTEPAAYGSGMLVAQHYLNQGSDALTAVREAIKSNISCGGRILQFDWRTRKFHSFAK